jgi:hypothetical protein
MADKVENTFNLLLKDGAQQEALSVAGQMMCGAVICMRTGNGFIKISMTKKNLCLNFAAAI